MSEEPLISIIVLNYNAGKLLLDCIQSIQEIDYSNFEIILVDNVSEDSSQNECKKKFPTIKLIQNEKNFGYCEGNNIGMKNAKGEYFLILNPDTIVEKNLLKELLSAIKQYGEGLYQPKILSLDNKNILQSTGNMIHLFGFGFAKDKGKIDLEKDEKIKSIGYASGTCLFSTRNIFEKLNYFDSFLFLYHDDLDICWRGKMKGINSYYVPNSKIYHAESYSLKWSKNKFYWLERNRLYCLKTHYSESTINKIKWELKLIELLVWIFYISKGYFFAKFNAQLDLKRNNDLIIKKHNQIEKEKIIDDVQLVKQFPDKIEVPPNVSEGLLSRVFIKLIEIFSKNAKKKIFNN